MSKINLVEILDLLCYAYYVKCDNLVSDRVFDALEKLYSKETGNETAPMRGNELAKSYSHHTKMLYRRIKELE